jgi:hypothetical protein
MMQMVGCGVLACLCFLILFFLFLVLTKVIVYAGIAILAAEVLPLAFDLVGWGVKSWPVP